MTQAATSEAPAAGLRQAGTRDLNQVCSNGTEREEADWRDLSGHCLAVSHLFTGAAHLQADFPIDTSLVMACADPVNYISDSSLPLG